MKFKHRIWLLPAMTAVIVTIGLLVSSQMTSRTATALTRVEKVQYPTVEALRTIRAELQGIEESLQRAVAEGDQQALATAEQRATALRHALHELAAADASSTLDETLSSAFETYFDAAVAATRIMLGKQSGDATAAITRMQQSSQVLQTALTQAQDAAIAEFRALLASGTANISQSKVVSLVMAVVTLLALGVGSWILIGSVFRRLGGEPEVAADIVRAIAGGDFTTVVNLSPGDDSSLLHGIETLRAKLGRVIRDVGATSHAVDGAASDIHEGIDQLSRRSAEQASSLEETASSMEEMSESVQRTADNARHASELAAEARARAERGGSVATRAVAAMTEINTASRRIADIIGVIDEIAFQTNLLALNAAVEAARAGEQGRGFAVVASEVQNLARRSATAAREIKELIQDSVAKVQDGSKLVDESGQHLQDIVAAAKKVADIIGEISSTSSQQAVGLQQVSAAVAQMDGSTQQNAAMAQETSSVAASLTTRSRSLAELIAVFRVEGGSPAAAPRPVAAMTAVPTPAVRQRARRPALKKIAGSAATWQQF